MLIKIYELCENDSRKPVYVGTKSSLNLLSLVNKDLPVKNVVFTQKIIIFVRVDFEGLI